MKRFPLEMLDVLEILAEYDCCRGEIYVGDGVVAVCDPTARKIIVSSDLTMRGRMHAFLHEFYHARRFLHDLSQREGLVCRETEAHWRYLMRVNNRNI
jgi:hypothetical protein